MSSSLESASGRSIPAESAAAINSCLAMGGATSVTLLELVHRTEGSNPAAPESKPNSGLRPSDARFQRRPLSRAPALSPPLDSASQGRTREQHASHLHVATDLLPQRLEVVETDFGADRPDEVERQLLTV